MQLLQPRDLGMNSVSHPHSCLWRLHIQSHACVAAWSPGFRDRSITAPNSQHKPYTLRLGMLLGDSPFSSRESSLENLQNNKKTLDLKERTEFGTLVANRHNDPALAAIKTLESFVPAFLMLTGTNEPIERGNKSPNRRIGEEF